MLTVIQNDLELTRRGFVTNYPEYRHWRKEAIAQGLTMKPLNMSTHICSNLALTPSRTGAALLCSSSRESPGAR